MKGSIDLITNAGFLGGRPVAEYLSHAVSGNLPKDLLSTFLHEASHQWCLWTPVGNALALLNMEVQRACASDPVFLLTPSAVPLQARASTARRILEPLLEGLAQFAEFDLYSGSSSAASSLTNWTVAIFGRDTEIPMSIQGSDRLNALLIRMRLDDRAVRRKADMLVRPLTAERGGYLIGYLTVKNLWHAAQRNSTRLRDPDLFMMYLRSLIFCDHGLVQMLLAPPADEYEDLNILTARLHARLKLLHRSDLDESVGRYERAVTDGMDPDEQCDCLFLDQEVVKASRSAYAERTKLPTKDDLSEVLSGEFKTVLSSSELAAVVNRSTIRIRLDQVVLQISQDGTCKVKSGDDLLLEASCFPDVPEGTVSGWLALYFLPTYLSLALICGSERGAVFAIFIACSKQQAVPKQHQRGYAEAMARVVRDEDSRGLLHEVIESDDFEDLDNSAVAKVLPKVTPSITNLYLNHALCFVSDEKLGELRIFMEKNGFWNVLSEKGDAPHKKSARINGMAAFGMLRTFASDKELVAQLMEQQGFSLEEVVANLTRSGAEHGYLLGVQPTGSATKGKVTAFRCLV